MNALLLPGNSKHNKVWIHRVNEALSDIFTFTIVHHYAHWENGEDFIKYDYEISRVIDECKDIKPDIIFAKSIGSVLTIKGLAEKSFQPNYCILVGLPLTIILEENLPIRDWLKGINIPIMIVQNNNDPFGAFTEINKYIDSINNKNVSVVKLYGDTHDYNDIKKLKELVSSMAS